MSNIPSELVRKKISQSRGYKCLSNCFGYAVRARAAYALSAEPEKINAEIRGYEETIECPINVLSNIFYIPPQFVREINASCCKGLYGCFSHDDFNCFPFLYRRTDFMQTGRQFLDSTNRGNKFDKIRSDPKYRAQAVDYSVRLLKCAFVANRHENDAWNTLNKKRLMEKNDLALQVILAYGRDMQVSLAGLPQKASSSRWRRLS